MMKRIPKNEKGFYILLLTLASQTALDKAIEHFENGERIEGKRELAKAIRFAFWAAYLMHGKSEVGNDEVSGFVQALQTDK